MLRERGGVAVAISFCVVVAALEEGFALFAFGVVGGAFCLQLGAAVFGAGGAEVFGQAGDEVGVAVVFGVVGWGGAAGVGGFVVEFLAEEFEGVFLVAEGLVYVVGEVEAVGVGGGGWEGLELLDLGEGGFVGVKEGLEAAGEGGGHCVSCALCCKGGGELYDVVYLAIVLTAASCGDGSTLRSRTFSPTSPAYLPHDFLQIYKLSGHARSHWQHLRCSLRASQASRARASTSPSPAPTLRQT